MYPRRRIIVEDARAAEQQRRQLVGKYFNCGDGDGMWKVLDVFRERGQWLVAYAAVADLDAGGVAGAWAQQGAGSAGGGGVQVLADGVESSSLAEVQQWITQYRRRLISEARGAVSD